MSLLICREGAHWVFEYRDVITKVCHYTMVNSPENEGYFSQHTWHKRVISCLTVSKSQNRYLSKANICSTHHYRVSAGFLVTNAASITWLTLGLRPANEPILCNDVSHWLGTSLASALYYISLYSVMRRTISWNSKTSNHLFWKSIISHRLN